MLVASGSEHRMQLDDEEAEARALLAMVQWQYGDQANAAEAWNAARDASYFSAMIARAEVVDDELPMPAGLPGNEPVDVDQIVRLIAEHDGH
jgi:hypothetical protein